MRFLSLFVVLILVTAAYGIRDAAADKSPTTTSPAGAFVGKASGNTISFLGIPYAESFAGERKWMPPVPKAKNEKPFVANDFGTPCPHMEKFQQKSGFKRAFSGGEDCLSLNIWVPRNAFRERSNEKVPVMFFLPGGGFQVGGSSWQPFGLRIYDGERLAALGNVIVVTANYRTGTNGFFYDEALAAREPMVGNLGHLDQIQALTWVRDNIAFFGGDPKNVTAFGSSAGAMSICNLMTIDRAKGLFHKAIIESGTCWVQSKEHALSTNKTVVDAVGCDKKENAERTKCLLATPAEKLTTAEPEMDYQEPALVDFHFAPIVDNTLLSAMPDKVITDKKHHAMPILIGANEHEMPPLKLTASSSDWELLLSDLKVDKAARQKIKALYERQNAGLYENMISALKTDALYICRARYFARIFSEAQKEPVYLYHFDKKILDLIEKWIQGSFHGMELYYIFQHVPPHKWLPGVAPHIEFQEQMGALWTHFARHGNIATFDEWKGWKPYTSANRIAGQLGDNNGVLIDPHSAACGLLEDTLFKNGMVSLTE